MNVSEHLCGVAIASPGGKKVSLKNGTGESFSFIGGVATAADIFTSRPQGSRPGYQKRQIADAITWMCSFPYYKRDKYGKGPLFFVCTTSPKWGPAIFEPQIAKFVNNLRMSYGLENYLWVREFTLAGAPHYHFVADIPSFSSPVGISRYWSNLFSAVSVNCVRLGSKPDKRGKRIFRINPRESQRAANYLTTYLSKQEKGGKEYNTAQSLYRSMAADYVGRSCSLSLPGRKFAISQEVATNSKPVIYRPEYEYIQSDERVMTASGQYVEKPAVATYSLVNQVGEVFDKRKYTWRQVKNYPVYFGKLRGR